MAILKLKDELRSNLYYNKYTHKATFKEAGLSYSRYVDTLEEFNDKIKLVNEYRLRYKFLSDRPVSWDSMNLDTISKFLSWKQKHKEYITIRLEQDSVSIFFNDIEVLNDLENFIPEISLTTINLQATGKLFFKKTPKYSYRMYFKQNIYKFGEELGEFIANNANNKDMCFSKSLSRNDNSRLLHTRLPYYYFNSRGFIDYNSESTLTLLHMYFSGAIGKVYKLEKEPE